MRSFLGSLSNFKNFKNLHLFSKEAPFFFFQSINFIFQLPKKRSIFRSSHPEVFLQRCSENVQQIYRRTTMRECEATLLKSHFEFSKELKISKKLTHFQLSNFLYETHGKLSIHWFSRSQYSFYYDNSHLLLNSCLVWKTYPFRKLSCSKWKLG